VLFENAPAPLDDLNKTGAVKKSALLVAGAVSSHN
jgi:hypothetical protein